MESKSRSMIKGKTSSNQREREFCIGKERRSVRLKREQGQSLSGGRGRLVYWGKCGKSLTLFSANYAILSNVRGDLDGIFRWLKAVLAKFQGLRRTPERERN